MLSLCFTDFFQQTVVPEPYWYILNKYVKRMILDVELCSVMSSLSYVLTDKSWTLSKPFMIK